ncbi:12094_t:CDS:2 [Cetraspora pellucida]|uniref:12094_t:CDS:1 n=1 Tax=Cetraspora pellucida TaxID=1433469 RepID=A0A9N9ERX0_9GLOM|nr:12094_t:CDS:2 [Cetraspora pellucida]
MIDNEVDTSENLIFKDEEWMLNKDMSFEYNEENFEEDVENFEKYSEKQFNKKYHEDYKNSKMYSEEDFEEYYKSNFTTNLEDDY